MNATVRKWGRPFARMVLCGVFAGLLSAAEPVRTVPPAVAELLMRCAQSEPAEVVRLIDGWQGESQPLLTLRRAQARWRLAQDAATAQRPDAIAAAEADFNAALGLDATLREARLGLAQCAAAREDWPAACRAAAAAIDCASADKIQIGFLAQTALRAGDWRLATIAAQQGILRFPDDDGLRRTELAVLMHAGRAEDARQAVLALLARTPDDADLWRHLAWSAQETNRPDESLAALEAAVVLRPADNASRRQLAAAQLGRGLPQAALATVRPLLGDTPAAAILTDDAMMILAARAAAEGGEPAQARTWLAMVPAERRSRTQRLLAARLAVQAGDKAAAAEALEALVALGEQDAAVLAWAAALADERDEAARAEALYLQAAGRENPAGAAASLRLAAFYLRRSRPDEARTILAAYLAKHPDDAQARALQTHCERKAR